MDNHTYGEIIAFAKDGALFLVETPLGHASCQYIGGAEPKVGQTISGDFMTLGIIEVTQPIGGVATVFVNNIFMDSDEVTAWFHSNT